MTEPETPQLAEDGASIAQKRAVFWPLWAGAGLLLLGFGLLAAGALLESRRLAGTPWRDAVLVVSGEAPWEGMLPARLRNVPDENFPDSPLLESLRQEPGGQELIGAFALDAHESVLLLDGEALDWDALLQSGRAPQPGANEAAAGPLCRLDAFDMDGRRIETTGVFRHGVAAVPFSYVMPRHESVEQLFAESAGGGQAWVDPNPGEEATAEAVEAVEGRGAGAVATTYRSVAALTVVGQLAAACGGAFVWVWLFGFLARLLPAPIALVFDAPRRFLRTTIALHALLYGLFFGMMALALAFPTAQMRVVEFTRAQFDTGALSEIGQAYRSGDVLAAAWTTWRWNFLFATLLMAVLPSFLIPFWGVIKHGLTFAFVGFGMAPLWAGTAKGMTYHGVTLILEMEAYVISAIYVTLYPVLLTKAALRKEWGHAGEALRLMAGGAVVAGLMLWMAALYEAVSLIFLHGF